MLWMILSIRDQYWQCWWSDSPKQNLKKTVINSVAAEILGRVWVGQKQSYSQLLYEQGIYVKYLFLGTAGKTNRNGATRLQRMQLWMSLPGIYWCLLAFFPVSLLH